MMNDLDLEDQVAKRFQIYSRRQSGCGREQHGFGWPVAGETNLGDAQAVCRDLMLRPEWAGTFGGLVIVDTRTWTVVAEYPPPTHS